MSLRAVLLGGPWDSNVIRGDEPFPETICTPYPRDAPVPDAPESNIARYRRRTVVRLDGEPLAIFEFAGDV